MARKLEIKKPAAVQFWISQRADEKAVHFGHVMPNQVVESDDCDRFIDFGLRNYQAFILVLDNQGLKDQRIQAGYYKNLGEYKKALALNPDNQYITHDGKPQDPPTIR